MTDAAPLGEGVKRRDAIAFVLPFAMESLNVRDTKHWAERSRTKRNVSQEVMVAMGGPRHFPRPPWRHVHIRIVRCSAGRLDPDNLAGSVKDLLDALCVRSPTHPAGLGIIEDDNSDLVTLEVTQSSAAVGQGSTAVRIERRIGVAEAPKRVVLPVHKPKRRRGEMTVKQAHALGIWTPR